MIWSYPGIIGRICSSLLCGQPGAVDIPLILFGDHVRYFFTHRDHQLLADRKIASRKIVLFPDPDNYVPDVFVFSAPVCRNIPQGIARMNGGNKFSAFGFIGTPEYSAPEQITREQNGTSVQINATTDIYALGITFYELLTGGNPMASNVEAETLTRQMRNSLPNSDLIPHKLMNVLWKATEKEQAKRYQTARAFKEAIEASLLPDPPMSERIGQWLRQYWVLVVGIAVGLFVVISIIIVIIFMLWN